jgi:carboxypeptidase family protein
LKFNFRTLFLIVLSLLMPAAIVAQTHRASVRGLLTDPRGAVVERATVRLRNTATGETRETTSGSTGEYAITSLAPGSYELTVESQYFKKYSHPLELLVNEERRYDVSLEVGNLDPVVLETTFEPGLKKENASLGTVIENRQVTGLPLDGRNFYELSLLVPGAVPPAQGSAGSVRGDFAFSERRA